ncbi:class II histone deacetylase complex subunits 2 and 3-domain-containing protein [Pyronema omphalodes]|nr:class II histone deacetylase complex subunits 2 and 3-domain-containing protein [Pyronema omphalodes]
MKKLEEKWKAANAIKSAHLTMPLGSLSTGLNSQQPVYISSSPLEPTYATVVTSSSSHFRIPELNDDEYPVLLPMTKYQREVYLSKIEECMHALDHYLDSSERENPDIAEPVYHLVERLVKVGSHPKLAQNEDLGKESTEDLWEWSSKLSFLKELIDKVADESIKIGIVAHDEASVNLLELLCRSLKVTYRRMDRMTLLPEIGDERGMVQVYLVSMESQGAVGAACQLVIALDGSWDANNYTIKQLRANPYDPSKQAPVIRLININAIDHTLLSLDEAAPGFQSLYHMALAVKGLRDSAGVLPESLDTVTSPVDAVSAWIVTRCQSEYPLPTKLPCIAEFDIHTLAKVESPEQPQATSRKRLSSPDTDDSRKRQQLESDGNVKMQDPSEVLHPEEGEEDAKMDVTMDLDATDTESEPDIYRHRPKVSTPILRSLDSIPPEKQTPAQLLSSYKLLLSEIQNLQAVHAQYKTWGSRLQSAYESQRSEIAALKSELSKLKSESEGAKNQGKRDRESNTVLRGEINQLNATLRDTEPVLSKEVQDLKKKLNNLKGMEKEAEFAREQYQNCSAAAAEMKRDLDKLTTENEDLKRKADFRVVELQKLSNERAIEMWQEEKQKLKEKLKEREDRIQRLENREASVVKRSVGRRVGSPAYGSRGNSPAIGGRERRDL